MSSIFNASGNDESKAGASAPVKPPQDPGTNWDTLRGLTSNAYQLPRSTRLRTTLLALLLIVALGSLGLVLHNHMPALVSFGEQLSETVHRFAAGSPAPSMPHEAALPDLRRARKQIRPSRAPVAESQPDQAYDPAFHPFYATAVVGGRRVALVSNNSIVMLDMDNGTWTFDSELE